MFNRVNHKLLQIQVFSATTIALFYNIVNDYSQVSKRDIRDNFTYRAPLYTSR